jgi:hypothetical protein
MEVTELDEIRILWESKYPNVTVTLWSNQDGNEHYGMMTTLEGSIGLRADTIGDLISQGESFLRKVT